ncbi:MAG: type I-C CRISPR-associated protein Cas8c/Csd1 [Ruminococcus sp.]|nr:type I-C CRISPR-associated protein Cas8c/Csd1 [Ruminococcus sp.]
MSWTNELYNIYELNCGREFGENEPLMLPISHSIVNAQLEIKIDGNGEFKGVNIVNENDSNTIIPDTGKAKVGITPPPFPLTETLKYIAGDFNDFASDDFKDNSDFYTAYINQLKNWCGSEFSHKSVNAVLEYVSKATVIKDCIESRVLAIDESTGKLLKKQKTTGATLDKTYVRFIVYSDDVDESRTWEDKSLYDSFINFNSKNQGEIQLCYATGEELPPIYTHPYQIVRNNPRAKLISSNDESGFTYRGRFSGKEEAISVSYEFSQKMHNALKWLISKQSMHFDSLTLIVWASGLQPVPDVRSGCFDDFDDEIEEKTEIPDTVPKFRDILKNRIFGYKQGFETDTKVMIMGLDAATTGRLSISIYSELMGSHFLENIEKWHKNTVWYRFSGKRKRTILNSFSLYEIARCAFGGEQGGRLECSGEVMKETALRLIPCVTEGAKLPEDIVQNLYYKASKPLSYEKAYNHRTVLEMACAMYRKELIDKNNIEDTEGEYLMAYNPDLTDRSYLYGCLLAIADKAESDTYESGDREKRVTNARRYWSAFAQRPCQTWQNIEERLRPYMDKLGGYRVGYEKLINEVMGKFNAEEFADNSRLSPLYLLGYHHFTAKMYTGSKKEEE